MKENREAHRVTAEGWDVVAEAKYEAEFDEHLGLLRRGGHTLLEPELDLMGTLLPGSHVVHLQCSHGLDALGLLNLGARSVLGVDISRQMIRQAAAKAEAFRPGRAEFILADVLELPRELAATADLVYTGRGSLPWVLDIRRWADTVARVLRPGAHAFIFEGHPLDALWERETSTLELRRGVGYFDDEPRGGSGVSGKRGRTGTGSGPSRDARTSMAALGGHRGATGRRARAPPLPGASCTFLEPVPPLARRAEAPPAPQLHGARGEAGPGETDMIPSVRVGAPELDTRQEVTVSPSLPAEARQCDFRIGGRDGMRARP